jgi:hypothetical protein
MNFMDSLKNAVTASVMTRLLANIFVFLFLCTSLVVAAIQVINGHEVSPIIMTVLGTGIGYALHVLGINQGVTLEPSKDIKKPDTSN